MPPCVQYDDLWPGGPRFARSGAGFALGTDSVLLADFAADRRVRRFADLGCGAGVLTVLLLHALPQAQALLWAEPEHDGHADLLFGATRSEANPALMAQITRFLRPEKFDEMKKSC